MRISKAIPRALHLSRAGHHPAAWRTLFRFRSALSSDPELAAAWVELTVNADAAYDRRADLLVIVRSWAASPAIVAAASEALLDAFDGRPHDHRAGKKDPMRLLAEALQGALLGTPEDAAARLRHRLGTALRLSGQHEEAVAVLSAAVAAEPEEAGWRYDLGLACKFAARFADGLAHFQRYAELRGDDDEGLLWNIAICATGAGQGEVALAAWHAMGMTDATIGSDGLPKVPDLGQITVRVPQGDALIEVAAWPRSPCHGLLEVPIGGSGLWDGTPIRPVQPGQSPFLPLLARL